MTRVSAFHVEKKPSRARRAVAQRPGLCIGQRGQRSQEYFGRHRSGAEALDLPGVQASSCMMYHVGGDPIASLSMYTLSTEPGLTHLHLAPDAKGLQEHGAAKIMCMR